MRKCECIYSFNHDYMDKSKFYFFSSGKREKLKFWGAIVRAKAWTLILGLKPHLLMRMRPRRSKWLGRSQNRWSCQKRVEGRGPRRSSSSDRTNLSQAGIRVTWVIFQETPTMKIDFRPRLSKSGSYVGSWEVGRIVNCRIESWMVRSYLFSDFKQKTYWKWLCMLYNHLKCESIH